MDLGSAIYWLFPVLSASDPCGVLRRIILRDVDYRSDLPFPLSFRELDLRLAQLPMVQVMLIYPGEDYYRIIRREMPLTTYFERVHDIGGEYTIVQLFFILFLTDPSLDVGSVDYIYDPASDPLGPDALFHKIPESIEASEEQGKLGQKRKRE